MRINRELWRTDYIWLAGNRSNKEVNIKSTDVAMEGGMTRMHSAEPLAAEGFKRKEKARRKNCERGNRGL